jgi:hypothetical protein
VREGESSAPEPLAVRPPAARIVVDRAGEGEPSGRVLSDGVDLCGREGSGVLARVLWLVAADATF